MYLCNKCGEKYYADWGKCGKCGGEIVIERPTINTPASQETPVITNSVAYCVKCGQALDCFGYCAICRTRMCPPNTFQIFADTKWLKLSQFLGGFFLVGLLIIVFVELTASPSQPIVSPSPSQPIVSPSSHQPIVSPSPSQPSISTSSITDLPDFFISFQVQLATREGRFADIVIPSYSRNTPRHIREDTARKIAQLGGFVKVFYYSSEESIKANFSESYRRSNPRALRDGYLGTYYKGTFTPGEDIYP